MKRRNTSIVAAVMNVRAAVELSVLARRWRRQMGGCGPENGSRQKRWLQPLELAALLRIRCLVRYQ